MLKSFYLHDFEIITALHPFEEHRKYAFDVINVVAVGFCLFCLLKYILVGLSCQSGLLLM